VDKTAVGHSTGADSVTNLFSLDLQSWKLVLLVFVGSLRCRIIVIVKVLWEPRWKRLR
jgi:hypothetical protein